MPVNILDVVFYLFIFYMLVLLIRRLNRSCRKCVYFRYDGFCLAGQGLMLNDKSAFCSRYKKRA